jgi:AAA+ superfamily predicted ATPase
MEINRQQRETENAKEYRTAFGILHQASVGIVLTRTREPWRVQDTLREFAFAESKKDDQLDFKLWTNITGWQSFDRDNPAREPALDLPTAEPFTALRAISPLAPAKGFGNGVYVMLYPHFVLGKHPGMIQIIKEYARMFTESPKRLVLVCPLGFTLPPELEDDVTILDFDTPSYSELTTIFGKLMGNLRPEKRPRFDAEQIKRLIALGAGMTAQEYENTIARALVTHKLKLPNVPLEDFAKVITDVKTEVVKRSEVLEMMQAEDMSSVGGLENLKEWVIKRRSSFSEEAKQYGIDAPKGIALIGPPGTGKSLAAKAIASSLGLPLIRFDIGRVFNSLVGSSEQRVRAALKLVDAMAPCVLMIDEVDKAFQANSGGGDSGVSQRVLGAILTWMQETKSPVFMVVTANRVNNLPSEFLRRGRLDDVFSVALPSEEERLEILKIHLRKRNKNAELPDLGIAVERSSGYVPSELEAAVKDALIEAFSTKSELTGELIAEQLGNMRPLSEAFKEDFDAMQTWAVNNARPANKGVSVEAVRSRTRNRSGASVPAARAVNLDG